MKMKAIGKYLVVSVAWLTLNACAQVIAQTAEASHDSDHQANTPVVSSWRGLVEPLVAHPEILTKNWDQMRIVLPVGCFQNARNRDLSCPPMDGVVRVSVDPGPLGVIDVVLKPPATCEQVYAVVSKQFGKGVLEDGGKCHAKWKLKRWVRGGHARLASDRDDPSMLYFQIGIEQGP